MARIPWFVTVPLLLVPVVGLLSHLQFKSALENTVANGERAGEWHLPELRNTRDVSQQLTILMASEIWGNKAAAVRGDAVVQREPGDWTLVGIIMEGGDKKAVIWQPAENEAKRLQIGDELNGAGTIEDIREDLIVLKNGDNLTTYYLYE